MPPSGRRGGRARKEVDPPPSENDSTPLRKRRKVNGGGVALATPTATSAPAVNGNGLRRRRDSDQTLSGDEGKELDNATFDEKLAALISGLKTAHYQVQAEIDHANSALTDTRAAFGKIVGRNWTYLMTKMEIIIGRPTEPRPVYSDNNPEPSAYTTGPNKFDIDIDLGPEKLVSRVHAVVSYDEDAWYILVNGRNSLRLDEKLMVRGQKYRLHSGQVITILGTQMMFITTDRPTIAEHIVEQLVAGDEEGSEDQDEERRAHSHVHPKQASPKPQTSGFNSYQPSSQPGGSQAGGHQPTKSDAHLTYATNAAPTPPASYPLPNTPLVSRTKDTGAAKHKGSPANATARNIVMESTEDTVDYSLDENKDIKPPYSYAVLIAQAILSAEDEQMTLNNIYEYIKKHYSYFRYSEKGWQNSIRHNLSLNKSFDKVPRKTDEPGKGMKWMIHPEKRDSFLEKNTRPRKGQGRLDSRASSGPLSPAMKVGSTSLLQAPFESRKRSLEVDKNEESNTKIKVSPTSATPPNMKLLPYPAQNESYTPGRGPRQRKIEFPNGSFDEKELHTPVISRRSNGVPSAHGPNPTQNADAATRHAGLKEMTANSPPPLSSLYSARRNNEHLDAGAAFQTPLIARNPQLFAPSTMHEPSKFLTLHDMSSPAFWKQVNFGSTPARGLGLGLEGDDSLESPVKGAHFNGKEKEKKDSPAEVDVDDGDKTQVMPSSPPTVDGVGEVDSPTRQRPGSRKDAGRLSRFGELGAGISSLRGNIDEEDDDDDEPIDLAKGLQRIGSYHQALRANGFKGLGATQL